MFADVAAEERGSVAAVVERHAADADVATFSAAGAAAVEPFGCCCHGTLQHVALQLLFLHRVNAAPLQSWEELMLYVACCMEVDPAWRLTQHAEWSFLPTFLQQSLHEMVAEANNVEMVAVVGMVVVGAEMVTTVVDVSAPDVSSVAVVAVVVAAAVAAARAAVQAPTVPV